MVEETPGKGKSQGKEGEERRPGSRSCRAAVVMDEVDVNEWPGRYSAGAAAPETAVGTQAPPVPPASRAFGGGR